MHQIAGGTSEMEVVTAVLEEPAAPARALPIPDGDRQPAALRPCLHCHPPATPASFYRRRLPLLVAIGALFAFLATSAAIANAWLPMQWDLPIQRWVEANRTDVLDTFFLTMSRFGSTIVVLSMGALLSLLTWNKCRAVSIALAVATFGRPLIEFVLKALVDRDRPDLERMVNGHGPSFPSGHVMASVALWGLLPLVVALFSRSRVLWWMSVAVSGFLIATIAMSRMYLGVHWTSDVFAGLLLGSFFLLAIESVLDHAHRISGCGGVRRHEADGRVRAS